MSLCIRNILRSATYREPFPSSLRPARSTFKLASQRPFFYSTTRPSSRMPPSSPRIPHPRSKVLVLGSGNFGSCLADHLGDSEHDIFLWSRHKEFVDHFNEHHRNPHYLKEHAFSENIQAVGPELPSRKFLKDMDVLLFAIPTQALRQVV
jgi:NAD-dependent glycerol-3-phosphate dehydrogenase N-terminus